MSLLCAALLTSAIADARYVGQMIAQRTGLTQLRSLLLLFLGIPIPIIILIALFVR